MFRNIGGQKKVDFLLGDFKLYKECNNISLLKLQVLKVTNEIEYVFLIGNSNLIKKACEFLKGNNGVEHLGKKITIDLDFFFQVRDSSSFISHKLFEDENSWTEVLEGSLIGNNWIKIKGEFLARQENEKNSLFLNYQTEATKIGNVWQPLEEMDWYNAKNTLIGELIKEVRSKNEVRSKIENIKNLSNQENEIGKWIYEVFFSDSTKLRIEDKTPSEILNGLEAELSTINGVDSTLSEEDDTFERTVRDTEEGETVSENEGEREEISVSTDNDEENKEEPEKTEESLSPPLPENEEILNSSTEENNSKEETVSTTDQERVDIPETSLLEKIGRKSLIIGSIVIIVALILVVVSLIIRKKKVNKTSPNKLQLEQPIDKKDIDYDDSFVR